MKRAILIAGAVVAVGAIVWLSLASSGGNGQAVEIEPVGRRDVIAKVKASGEINPKTKVEIQSKVIGEIVGLPVKEGDTVRAGQVVLRVEPQLYEAAKNQAKAALDQSVVSLESARAELANAQLDLQRAEHLHAEGIVAQQDLDQARLARDTAEVSVRAQQQAIRQARSAYQRAQDDLDRTIIRSPMDGTVTALNVEKGETAVMGTMNFAGSVLMVIGDLSEMIAEVDVAESEIVPLALGQEATVTVDALPDTPMQGHVIEISSSGAKQVDVVKFKVKIALDHPDPRLKPGMTAKVEITTATAKGVLAVPQQAVQTRWLDQKGKEVEHREGDTSQHEVSVVYLLKGGKAERCEVKTGIHDELWVEVTNGLEGGEDVITGPYRTLRSLKSGDAVRAEKQEHGETKSAD
jgi:HlyD family secretion protein